MGMEGMLKLTKEQTGMPNDAIDKGEMDGLEEMKQMEELLIRKSMLVANGLETVNEATGKRYEFKWSELDDLSYRKTYCIQNGVVAFVDSESRMHIMPVTDNTHLQMKKAGYTTAGFEVPFSNGDIPVNPSARRKWEETNGRY